MKKSIESTQNAVPSVLQSLKVWYTVYKGGFSIE